MAVMTATPADIDQANQAIETMTATQDLIDLILDQNGGDLQKAADTMKPYDIAQRVLNNFVADLQKNPGVAYEGMKLMLEFAQTAHQNVVSDIRQVWLLEREASKILTASVSQPSKYSSNGGGAARLTMYRKAIELVLGYMKEGKAFMRIDTSWYNFGKGGKFLFHEASARKRRSTAPLETSHIHHIAAELYFDSIAAEPENGA